MQRWLDILAFHEPETVKTIQRTLAVPLLATADQERVLFNGASIAERDGGHLLQYDARNLTVESDRGVVSLLRTSSAVFAPNEGGYVQIGFHQRVNGRLLFFTDKVSELDDKEAACAT